jgi:hypothetical protein
MGALLRKELRDQRFFAVFGLVLFTLDLLELVFLQADRLPLRSTFGHESSSTGTALALIGFAVGTGLLAREIDDGTLAFLDGLPVSRLRVFTAKLVTAVPVLMVYPVTHLLLNIVEHLVARESLDAELYPRLLVTWLALVALQVTVGVLAGMVFGFTRSLAWAGLALTLSVLQLGMRHYPALSALNTADLADVHIMGTRWRIASTTLGTQLLLAAGFGLTALWAFNRSGRGRARFKQWLGRPVVSAIVAVFTVGAAMLFMTVETTGDKESKGKKDSASTMKFDRSPPGHAETAHYRFGYPSQRSNAMQPLLADGDGAFERLAALLRVDGGVPIDVDLSGSAKNTAGTTKNQSIRMKLDSERLVATLTHETTHVFERRLVGDVHPENLERMDVLNEGLAHWAERRLTGDGGFTETDREQIAAIAARKLVTPTTLLDPDILARDQDVNLHYPLGAELVDAVVRRYGPTAPRELLKTIGAPDFPRDLKGLELWQAAFQLAGFDLSLVLDDYARDLNDLKLEYATFTARLPRLRGSLVRKGDWVGVEVRSDLEVPADFTSVVRFRPREDSALFRYETVETGTDHIGWQRLKAIAQGRVCFQPGLESSGVALFEQWQCLPLESAAPLEEDP